MNAGETSAASRCPEAKNRKAAGHPADWPARIHRWRLPARAQGRTWRPRPSLVRQAACPLPGRHAAPPASRQKAAIPVRGDRRRTAPPPKIRLPPARSGVFSNKVIGNWAKISNAVSSRACTDRADSKRQAAHSSIQNPSFIFRSVMRSPRPPAASDATHESTPDHPYPQEKCLFPFSGPVPARQNGRASCP